MGTLQRPSEEAAYSVSSVGELTRLPSADTGAWGEEAIDTASDAGESTDGEGGTSAEPAAPLQRTLPKVRTAAEAPDPEPEAAETAEPQVTEPPPPPPSPPPEPVDPVWHSLAACESSGNWHIDTGNGYFGGLQFSIESWHGVGGQGYPHEHPQEVQIAMAERLRALQGWNAWPVCSRRLGLR